MVSLKDKPVQRLLSHLDTFLDLHYKVTWTKEEKPSHWAIDALYSKTFGHFKAIIRLFKQHAYLAESLVLLRSAYESTIVLCYILTNPDEHIPHYQNSAANYALKDIQRYKERNPSPPDWIMDYEALLESQATDKAFKMNMEKCLDHLMQVTPPLFDDKLARFYSIDLAAYYYGTSVAHSHPHVLEQLYISDTPYIGFKGILHCMLASSRLIRFYMKQYGCAFPANIETLDTQIFNQMSVFEEVRTNRANP